MVVDFLTVTMGNNPHNQLWNKLSTSEDAHKAKQMEKDRLYLRGNRFQYFLWGFFGKWGFWSAIRTVILLMFDFMTMIACYSAPFDGGMFHINSF